MNWQRRKEIFFRKMKSGDYKELKRLILRRLFINLILWPVGVPVSVIFLPLLYLIEPFKKIRIAIIYSDRIGHFALNTELFLRKKQLKSEAEHDKLLEIFILKQGKVVNRQLLTMYQRNLFILENQIFYWLIAVMDWVFARTRFHFDLPMADNEDFEFKNTSTSLHLTEDEESRGRPLLKSMGVKPGEDWFVCIHSRDSRYLAEEYPEKNWSYHDYRDSDIDDFNKAIKFIVNQGGFVIRMGSKVEKPLTLQHHKVIDYAINYRNDFMDVYLVSKCKYFLGTSAGICDLATVMDKPRISVNYTPIGVALFGKDCLYIPKKLKNEKTGMYIPLSAVLKNNWDKNWVDNDWLNQHCYEYEDNTPEEILEATIEMHKRTNGHFKMSSEENDLIKKYFDLFHPDNLSYNSQTPVGLDFLKKNPDVFWGEENLN